MERHWVGGGKAKISDEVKSNLISNIILLEPNESYAGDAIFFLSPTVFIWSNFQAQELLPGCHLVCGSHCRSVANGGVKRSNCTPEDKIGSWIMETVSKHWIIGLSLVQWEMNTQGNCGIGEQMAYRQLTGQNPCV